MSLHRAAASEELTNLSLCRDQGKMSAATDDACIYIVGIGLNISLFMSPHSTTTTHSRPNGVPMLQDDKKVRLISHPVWFCELEKVVSESFPPPRSCICVLLWQMFSVVGVNRSRCTQQQHSDVIALTRFV